MSDLSTAQSTAPTYQALRGTSAKEVPGAPTQAAGGWKAGIGAGAGAVVTGGRAAAAPVGCRKTWVTQSRVPLQATPMPICDTPGSRMLARWPAEAISARWTVSAPPP